MSTLAENKALYLRYQEALAAESPDALDEVLSPDFVAHDLQNWPGLQGLQAGVTALKAFRQGVQAAFSDQRMEVLDLIAEGDRVAARISLTQTHQGTFLGIPATDKRVTLELLEIVRIQEGKIVERWAQFDRQSVIQQLREEQAVR